MRKKGSRRSNLDCIKIPDRAVFHNINMRVHVLVQMAAAVPQCCRSYKATLSERSSHRCGMFLKYVRIVRENEFCFCHSCFRTSHQFTGEFSFTFTSDNPEEVEKIQANVNGDYNDDVWTLTRKESASAIVLTTNLVTKKISRVSRQCERSYRTCEPGKSVFCVCRRKWRQCRFHERWR